ncbi:MAG: hypothetical protein AAFX76_01720 [Planctomycetota bacterium]
MTRAPRPVRRLAARLSALALGIGVLGLAACGTSPTANPQPQGLGGFGSVAGFEVRSGRDYAVHNNDVSPSLAPQADIPAYRYPAIRRYGY